MTSENVRTGGATRLRLIQRKPAVFASLIVCLVVLVANAVYILKIRSNNPIMYHSGLGSPVSEYPGASWSQGHWEDTIDANDGWTAQALGRLAAEMWSSGHVPLWNLYEGLGQPLAGEMQSAALFLPFVMLQLLPNGIFAFHLALELVAGLSTLAFLRQLKVGWLGAILGGCLFAVNGAFSLMTNAPFNPIAFLPLALWGSESIFAAVKVRKRPVLGLWALALAVAFMLFSGFPETAYLECLFVAVWVAFRISNAKQLALRTLGWNVVGAVLGVVLAAPILVAFGQFLRFGYVGYHDGGSSRWNYASQGLVNFATPYLLGPYGVKPTGNGQAGYVTLCELLLAALAFGSAYRRRMKVCLGAIFSVLVLNMFGCMPVNAVVNLVPGVKNILLYKYGYSLVAFAVIVLIAFAVDDIRRGRISRRAMLIAGAGAFGLYLYVLIKDHQYGLLKADTWTVLVGVLTLLALVAVVGLVWRARSGRRLSAIVMLIGVVLGDGVAMYAVPQVSASEPRPVDTAPIEFLKMHLGTSRFYTLGPIQPNYGSYWGLAELNINDLPVPKKTSTYLKQRLSPAKGSPGARGTGRAFLEYELTPLNFSPRIQKTLLIAYGQQQKYFREAGTKYLVTSPGVVTPADEKAYGLRHVFTSRKTEIFEDADAATYYQTVGASCTQISQSYESVKLRCDKPSKLTRLQLLTPGWSASVNGERKHLQDKANTYFQTVDVPAGTSTVSYAYMPQYFRPAVALSLITLGAGALDVTLVLMRRRRSLKLDASVPRGPSER